MSSKPQILFVTGKLAERSLRQTVAKIASESEFDFSVCVLPITVAALATTQWIARHLTVPEQVNRILIPGLCLGELEVFDKLTTATVERGPKDLRDLPEYFHGKREAPSDYGEHDIEILAEINFAPRLSLADLIEQSCAAKQSGADIIDLGCEPGHTWSNAGDVVRALREQELRVSIDSFNSEEVSAAAGAGAELVLSVNSTNREQATDWNCEVVAVPDTPNDLDSLDRTIQFLDAAGVPFRIDPVLEPIGMGFAASLGRYLEVRRRYPHAEIMMGVGNLTELTDVDSAGVNVMLAGFCQEAGIRSVLTTEVINWCRSSIRELDLARRLTFHSQKHGILPKHLEPNLVMLRDAKVHVYGEEFLRELANQIKDHNFRLFAEGGMLHAMNNDLYLQNTDPFRLFQAMLQSQTIEPQHAFYLGYEMAKAVTALSLGKDYVQDQALNWGFLTVPEDSHMDTMKNKDLTPKKDSANDGCSGT